MFTYGDTSHNLLGIAIYTKWRFPPGQSLVNILKPIFNMPNFKDPFYTLTIWRCIDPFLTLSWFQIP